MVIRPTFAVHQLFARLGKPGAGYGDSLPDGSDRQVEKYPLNYPAPSVPVGWHRPVIPACWDTANGEAPRFSPSTGRRKENRTPPGQVKTPAQGMGNKGTVCWLLVIAREKNRGGVGAGRA